MEIRKVIPSGYCKGVMRAIQLARKTRENNPLEDIYILGMIVHNNYVTKSLELLNIKTLLPVKSKEEWIDSLDHGILIFSAHGIAQKYKDRAIKRGLKIIDASCPDVIATQDIIKDKIKQGYDVLYIGKKNHPEAEAVLAISKHIRLITKKEDIEEIDINNKIFVTNQTTMSIFDIQEIFKAIKKKYPGALFEKELCHATTLRQNAVLNIKDCDCLIVVGDPASNNSNKLKEIGLKAGIKTCLMIECARDLKEEDIRNKEHIWVTAGASTPNYLTEQVIDVLNKYAQDGILLKPDVDLNSIL